VRAVVASLRASRHDEGGYTVTELLCVMAILGVVIGSLTVMLTSASAAQQRMSLEFQAQTDARMALDRLRREARAACSVTPAGASSTITFQYVTAGSCSGGNQVSWCTVANGTSRWGLHRQAGATCGASGVRVADHLTVATAFDHQTATGRRPKVVVTLAINPNPLKPARTYRLVGDVVLRNATRST